MITELPLLPNRATYWNWNVSNYNNATTEQVQRAYQAISNNGLCSDFSIYVWNDIVELLANTLNDAGLQWNETYGTAEECKINEKYGIFTARAFNGIALNINQFGLFHWKWEVSNNIKGYLGRSYVKGYSEDSIDFDYVYGWYIIELMKRFNELVSILDNTADFSQFDAPSNVKTVSSSVLSFMEVKPLLFKNESQSYYKNLIERLYVISLKIQTLMRSFDSGTIITRDSDLLCSSVISVSNYENKIKVLTTKPLKTFENIESKYSCQFRVLDKIHPIVYIQEIKTNYISDFVKLYSKGIDYIKEYKTYIDSSLNCINAYSFEYIKELSSYNYSIMNTFDGVPTGSLNISNSYVAGKMFTPDKVSTNYIEYLKSNYESILDKKIAKYFNVFSKSYSSVVNEINFCEAISIKKIEYLLSNYDANMSKCVSNATGAILKPLSYYISSLKTSFSNSLKFFPCYEQSKFNISLNDSVSQPIVTTQISKSNTNSELNRGTPNFVEFNDMELIYIDTELKKTESNSFIFGEKSETKNIVEINKCQTVVFDGNYKSSSSTVCELEIESTRKTWYDPVQNGTDLYVRNAYPQWKEDANVHLDSGGVFYEAEQTETNVYIRSKGTIKEV